MEIKASLMEGNKDMEVSKMENETSLSPETASENSQEIPASSMPDIEPLRKNYDELSGRYRNLENAVYEIHRNFNDFAESLSKGSNHEQTQEEQLDSLFADRINKHLSHYEAERRMKENAIALNEEASKPEYAEYAREIKELMADMGFSRSQAHNLTVQTLRKCLRHAKNLRATNTKQAAASGNPGVIGATRNGVAGNETGQIPEAAKGIFNTLKRRNPNLTEGEFLKFAGKKR